MNAAHSSIRRIPQLRRQLRRQISNSGKPPGVEGRLLPLSRVLLDQIGRNWNVGYESGTSREALSAAVLDRLELHPCAGPRVLSSRKFQPALVCTLLFLCIAHPPRRLSSD